MACACENHDLIRQSDGQRQIYNVVKIKATYRHLERLGTKRGVAHGH